MDLHLEEITKPQHRDNSLFSKTLTTPSETGGLKNAINRKAVYMEIRLKRVYDQSAKEDGTRILVDRLWPRGLTKQRANVDMWLKEIAPSTELRKWFHHDPQKWTKFQKRYLIELKEKREQLNVLRNELKAGTVTLVYGAKDEHHNEARVLMELLSRGLKNRI